MTNLMKPLAIAAMSIAHDETWKSAMKSLGTLILMTLLCVAVFIVIMAVRPAPGQTQSRSFYDRSGSFAGSSVTHGNT